MDILSYILDEGLIMIPTLYVIAEILKSLEIVSYKHIPLILLGISIAFTPLILDGGYVAENIIQAILLTGATVYTNQVYKQARSDE